MKRHRDGSRQSILWDRHNEWTVGVGNEWGWGQDDYEWVGKGAGTQGMSLTIVNEHGMESR